MKISLLISKSSVVSALTLSIATAALYLLWNLHVNAATVLVSVAALTAILLRQASVGLTIARLWVFAVGIFITIAITTIPLGLSGLSFWLSVAFLVVDICAVLASIAHNLPEDMLSA